MPQFVAMLVQRKKPAHRAKATARMRFASIGGLLTSAAIIGGGAFAGLTSVGGTYAFWNGSQSVSAADANSGNMSLVVGDGSAPYVITAVTNLFPGDAVLRTVSVAVHNSPSTLPSALVVKVDGSSAPGYQLPPNGFIVRVKKGPCTGTPFTGGTVLGITDQTLPSTWGGSETADLCVQVELPATALQTAQGQTDTITIYLSARQP